jgi:hypothetical protein
MVVSDSEENFCFAKEISDRKKNVDEPVSGLRREYPVIRVQKSESAGIKTKRLFA